jgi:hypothetical protein
LGADIIFRSIHGPTTAIKYASFFHLLALFFTLFSLPHRIKHFRFISKDYLLTMAVAAVFHSAFNTPFYGMGGDKDKYRGAVVEVSWP